MPLQKSCRHGTLLQSFRSWAAGQSARLQHSLPPGACSSLSWGLAGGVLVVGPGRLPSVLCEASTNARAVLSKERHVAVSPPNEDEHAADRTTGKGEPALASLPNRCLAALIDGLVLLLLSALTSAVGLRYYNLARWMEISVDWESLHFMWFHLPTLCTLRPGTPVEQTIASSGMGAKSDRDVASLSWPIHCDISATAMMAHVYFDVAWNGQTPGKRVLGLRTVRLDGGEMDTWTALITLGARFTNMFYAVDFLWAAADISDRRRCLHNVASGTKVVHEASVKKGSTTSISTMN